MAYSKTCLLFLVFAALLLFSSRSSARELAAQNQQSVQAESVEEDLHIGPFHRHHHHHKHEHKHHKKPGHGHGHGGTGDAGKENMGSEMADGEN